MNALLSLAAFMAMMQNDDTDPDKAKFMDQYGPDKATRIALDRDDDGVANVIFSNVDGPKPDGATEMLQAAKVWKDGDTASVLIQLQRPTAQVGLLDDEEQYSLAAGMAEYLDRQPTVILTAKGDEELNDQTVAWFNYMDGDQVVTKTVDMMDFLVKGDWAYVKIGDKIGKIEAQVLKANLVNGVKSLLTGATTIVDIPFSAKLARGLKVDLGGALVDTAAYVTKDGDGATAKMTLLNAETLVKIDEIDFNGNYATAGHDDEDVCVITSVIDTGRDDIETFPVTRVPAAEFFQASAA